MTKSYSLKIDPEDLESLLLDLEMAFEVKFVQSDIDRLITVGDLYDFLQIKMGATLHRRERCIAAVCFYRLRRAVAEMTGARITPRTAIFEVFSTKETALGMKAIAEKTGLRLPSLPIALEQFLLSVLFVLSCCAALYFGLTTMSGITGLLIAIGFFCVLRFAEFPRRMTGTFGDLARETTTLNYGRLARETGVRSSADLWQALNSMIRICAAFEGEIERRFKLT